MFRFLTGKKEKKEEAGRQERDAAFTSVLDIPIGDSAIIRRHHSSGAVRQRLLDLGFIPGQKVEVLRVATLGCPLELKISEYCVTLRRTEAQQIEVE